MTADDQPTNEKANENWKYTVEEIAKRLTRSISKIQTRPNNYSKTHQYTKKRTTSKIYVLTNFWHSMNYYYN